MEPVGILKMTKTFLKGALLAAVAVVATPALAANPESFTANATIVKPLEISKVANLNFGTITMGSALTSASVTVDKASGAQAVCGTNLTCLATDSNPGEFDVAGVGTQTVSLSYGTAPTKLKLTSDATKTVDFTLDAPGSVNLVDGDGTFFVGGSITVASTTVPGTYSADLTVTASYQ
jgi:hypothetical protein